VGRYVASCTGGANSGGARARVCVCVCVCVCVGVGVCGWVCSPLSLSAPTAPAAWPAILSVSVVASVCGRCCLRCPCRRRLLRPELLLLLLLLPLLLLLLLSLPGVCKYKALPHFVQKCSASRRFLLATYYQQSGSWPACKDRTKQRPRQLLLEVDMYQRPLRQLPPLLRG
jgi:hypothetical protein